VILQISFLSTFAFSMFEVIVGLLMERAYLPSVGRETPEHIAAAAKLTAWFLVAVGITAVIVQGGLIGRLTKRFGETKLCRTGLLLMLLSIGAIPLTVKTGVYDHMLILAVVLAIGTGMYNPSQSSLVSRASPVDQQGGILGLNQSMSALGRVVGPALSGFLFEINQGLPFYTAAVVLGAAATLAMFVKPMVMPASASSS
jgi:MFS family permease